MINLDINNIYNFTIDEINHLNLLKNDWGQNYEITKGKKTKTTVWDDQKNDTRILKNKILKKLLDIQGYRCGYCDKSLINEQLEIDHIGPKHSNLSFCFEPKKLICSCSNCNGTDKKGRKETIITKDATYSNCDFLIVHPYIDNVTAHIVYQDVDEIFYSLPRCSNKGLMTIIMFKFYKEEMKIYRSGILLNQRKNPIQSDLLKSLIQKTTTYLKNK